MPSSIPPSWPWEGQDTQPPPPSPEMGGQGKCKKSLKYGIIGFMGRLYVYLHGLNWWDQCGYIYTSPMDPRGYTFPVFMEICGVHPQMPPPPRRNKAVLRDYYTSSSPYQGLIKAIFPAGVAPGGVPLDFHKIFSALLLMMQNSDQPPCGDAKHVVNHLWISCLLTGLQDYSTSINTSRNKYIRAFI